MSDHLQIILYGVGANVLLVGLLYVGFRIRIMDLEYHFDYRINKNNDTVSDLFKSLSASYQAGLRTMADAQSQQLTKVLNNQDALLELLNVEATARAANDTEMGKAIQKVKEALLSSLIQTNTLLTETSKTTLGELAALKDKNQAATQLLLEKLSEISAAGEELQEQLESAANESAGRQEQLHGELTGHFKKIVEQTGTMATQVAGTLERSGAQLETFSGAGQRLAELAETLAQRTEHFTSTSTAEQAKTGRLLAQWDERAVTLEELTVLIHKDSYLMLELLKAGLLSDLIKDMQERTLTNKRPAHGTKKRIGNIPAGYQNILDAGGAGNVLVKEVSALQARLDEPLRVAVVGVIKTGKSTLMNALLKSSLVSTGNLETTYNVCWFKYGPEPLFHVVFNDRSTESFPMDQLEHWTIRQKAAENQRIKSVKYIEVHLPVDELKTLELIDTPGLNSVYKTDSDNTFGILGMDGSNKPDHEQATIHEASIADAVIYAFNKPTSITDQQFLQKFKGDQRTISSPINAVGVLTQVDLTETGDDLSAIMRSARNRVKSKMKDRSVSSLLYSILPVAAKPMEGVLDLTAQEWAWLKGLAVIARDELWEELDNINKFIERPSDDVRLVIENEADRDALALKLTAHGVDTVADLFRKGHVQDDIYGILYETCGMNDLREVLLSHFGKRNLLIKSKYIFTRLRRLFAATPDNSPAMASLYRGITDRIWEMENSFQVFKELKVLQDHYNGLLGFSANELAEMLRLFGEEGAGCEQRLGVSGPAYISNMLDIAKSQGLTWRRRQHRAGLSRQQTNAIRTVISSYDIMIDLLSRLSAE